MFSVPPSSRLLLSFCILPLYIREVVTGAEAEAGAKVGAEAEVYTGEGEGVCLYCQ